MKTNNKHLWTKIISTCYDEDFRDNFSRTKAIAFFAEKFEVKEKIKKNETKNLPRNSPKNCKAI